MSKSSKIWIIIAISCIVVGAVGFVVTMSMLNWNFAELNTVKRETKVYDVTDEFENISVCTDTTDVLFLLSDDGKCKIECFEYSGETHTVKVEDKTLKINANDTKKWYDNISVFDFSSSKIKIYLPKSEYKNLSINVSTSDIENLNDFIFENVDVKLSTGDVNLTDVKCDNFALNCSTGDTKLKNVIATQKINIKHTTGDIKLDKCDADEIILTTTTGDVKGSLLSDKSFICNTKTGDINVPKSTSGEKCEITTSTGDIYFKIVK